MEDLGAARPSDEFILELFDSEPASPQSRMAPPPDFSTISGAYDIVGYQSSVIRPGGIIHQIYSLIVSSIGVDPYLRSVRSSFVVEGTITTTADAINFLNSTFSSVCGDIVSSVVPGSSWIVSSIVNSILPNADPDNFKFQGDTYIISSQSVTTMKYSYVYDANSDTWIHGATANKISVSEGHIFHYMSAPGVSSTATGNRSYTVLGNFNNTESLASSNFYANYTGTSFMFATNACMNVLRYYDRYNILRSNQQIFCGIYPSQLLF